MNMLNNGLKESQNEMSGLGLGVGDRNELNLQTMKVCKKRKEEDLCEY